jgi:hypothetical protein
MNFRPIACFVVTAATTIAAPAQNSKSLQSLSVSMPGNSWSLVVDAPGFAVESQGRKPDGREYLLANKPKRMLSSLSHSNDPQKVPTRKPAPTIFTVARNR